MLKHLHTLYTYKKLILMQKHFCKLLLFTKNNFQRENACKTQPPVICLASACFIHKSFQY